MYDHLAKSSTPWLPPDYRNNPVPITVLPHNEPDHLRDDVPPSLRSDMPRVLGNNDAWQEFYLGPGGNGGPTLAGVRMSADLAMRVAVFFACKRVISEDVGKLPGHLMRRVLKGDRQRTTMATDHALFDLLTSAPNDWMTSQELAEYMVGTAAIHGAAYAWLVRDQQGNVEEILPLLPGSCTRRQEPDWEITYQISGYAAAFGPVSQRDIWCLNGPMADSVSGWNMSGLAREALALAAAIEQSQSRYHKNDLRPSGVLSSKGALAKNQRDEVRSAWLAAYGPGGTGGIAVLDAEFDFKAITQSASDSQVIENRKFQIEEICRFMRVHPWAVMVPSANQSYGSLEQTGLAHISHTILPWARRYELTVKRDIIGRKDREHFFKLNVDAIARATLGDRMTAYEKAVKIFMSPNEIRDKEDMDPIDDPAMDRVQLQANNTGLTPRQTPPAIRPPAGSSEVDESTLSKIANALGESTTEETSA